MNKNRLLKLFSLVLLTVALLSGVLQGGPAPALALGCPDSFPEGNATCYWVSAVCDDSGCCCQYASDTDTLPCLEYCT